MLAMGLLTSCGGGSGGSDPTTTQSSAGTTLGETAGETGKAETVETDTSEQIRTNVKTGPLHLTGGSLEQYRDIGDYSTLRLGKEATPQALEEAARLVHKYLIAHVRYDWSASCSYLDERGVLSVKGLASEFKEVTGKDCPAGIAYLLGKVPARKAYVASEVNVPLLRVRRQSGFFFYRAGGDPYTFSLARDDDGNWKIISFFISEITPPPS